MNNIEEDNLFNLANKYKNICLSISLYVDLLKPSFNGMYILDVITELEVLKLGKYARLMNCDIWISPKIHNKDIKISNEDIGGISDNKWSQPIPLILADIDKIDRVVKLKAFW